MGNSNPKGEGGADSSPLGEGATRAYVEAVGELGDHYHNQYGAGNRGVIGVLRAEEANLLHARRLARGHGWWHRVTSAMQGLYTLYNHTGRRAGWARLVEEVVLDLVDPDTDGPLPGREAQWSLVTQYRVQLAREGRQWGEAERLQRAQVEWTRERAAPALDAPRETLDGAARNAVRSLAVSVEQLGHILREQGQVDCVEAYEEAISLYQRIGEQAAEVVAAFNLDHAYMQLADLRDLERAEEWYQRSLDLHAEEDRLGRSKCYGQLGLVACERFGEAREANEKEEVLLDHLNHAAQLYHQALDLLPPRRGGRSGGDAQPVGQHL